MLKIASASKIMDHTKRLDSYLCEKPVFPVTLELDLTTECTKACPRCPSIRSPVRLRLGLDFIETLFGTLEDEDPSVVMAGLESLSFAQDPSIAHRVEPLTGHPDPDVRQAAQDTLDAVR